MTTLNTIIEEEKEEFKFRFSDVDGFVSRYHDGILDHLTTAMQRAYEAGVEDGKATNTPNTEWEKLTNFGSLFGVNFYIETKDKNIIDYAQRFMESGAGAHSCFRMEGDIFKKILEERLTSRDTYWKEMVGELIEKTIQDERFSGAPYALNKLKEAITKDNLK